MTCGAVPIHAPLKVTTDAEPHVVHVVHSPDLGHPGDVAVTGLAGVGSHRLDVAHVGEMGVARDGVDPDPLEFGLAHGAVGPELPQLPDFRAIGAVGAAHHQVTAHAGFHRRNSRLGGLVHRV